MTDTERLRYFAIAVTFALQVAALAATYRPAARQTVGWSLMAGFAAFSLATMVVRP
jgi:hypothetical protein